MTEKLFYADAHMRKFTARVLSCEERGGLFAVTLDRTAFFPEGGGQGGDTGALNMLFTPFTALVFLIFTLLYTPCVAAIAAVKRELGGGRAALGVVLMQCGIAWVVAFAVHCVGVLLGLA